MREWCGPSDRPAPLPRTAPALRGFFVIIDIMTTTQIATDIGKQDNANGICALLSPVSQQRVTEILQRITDQIPDGIWCMPPSSLHITLCEIMQAKPYAEDKEVLFQRNADQYRHALKAILKDTEPIEITFDRIEVSPHAIIIRGSADEVLQAMRSELIELLPLPPGTKLPPTIVHSSIARFTRELNLKTVESIVAGLPISFTETITEFQLVHNGSPHMLNYEIDSRYPLIAR